MIATASQTHDHLLFGEGIHRCFILRSRKFHIGLISFRIYENTRHILNSCWDRLLCSGCHGIVWVDDTGPRRCVHIHRIYCRFHQRPVAPVAPPLRRGHGVHHRRGSGPYTGHQKIACSKAIRIENRFSKTDHRDPCLGGCNCLRGFRDLQGHDALGPR